MDPTDTVLAGSSTSAPASKRRKTNGASSTSNANSDDGHGNNNNNNKPKRQPSCDLCRARKVKCVKAEGQSRCDGCIGLNQQCAYTHERKKPGPANSFAKKPSPSRSVSQSAVNTHQHGPGQGRHDDHGGKPSSYSHPYTLEHHRTYSDNQVPEPVTYPTTSSHSHSQSNAAFPDPPSFENPFAMDPHWTDPSYAIGASSRTVDLPFLPISPSTLLHPMPGEIESSDGSPAGPWPWSNGGGWDVPDSNGQFAFSVGGWDPGPGGPVESHADRLRSSEMSGPSGPGRHGKKNVLSNRGIQRLEEVLEWSTMMRILHAYHAHLYPLLPIVHWPSFSQQLIAREDERSEHWRAFLLSLVAYSIIQLPRSSLTFIPVPELRRIHQRCHAESRKLQNRRYTKVALVDVTTLYCQHIYLGTLGRTNAANITLSEAIYLSRVLGLHDERLNRGSFDMVEREMRRRTFWLLYGSDRTISALTADPMHIYDADLCLPLPLALDDNLITPSGAFPQPPNITPVLSGFHYNTRLFRLLGEVGTLHKLIMSTSNSATNPFPILHLPPMLPTHPRPVRHFYDELERILSELPGPLQLFNPLGGEPTPNGSNQGDAPSKDSAAFAICRANLLVTQALVRFSIRQYAKVSGEPDAGEPGRDWAERDVLGLLESMSPESLAANGDSLRAKVLFVASSLLEKYPSTTEGHSYVSDFLAVYTRISQEQHISLLEPAKSGEASREATPGETPGM